MRRVTGRTIGTFFREEVAEPLGADFHIGLPASEDARVADIVPPDVGAARAGGRPRLDRRPSARSAARSPATSTRTRAWRGAEIPAAGGTGNARSVGRVHSALACGGAVDGVRLLSPRRRRADPRRAGPRRRPRARRQDALWQGFGLMSDSMPLSPNERAFFWGGWGGSIGVIDLDARMSVAYVMNKMASSLVGDLRGAMLVFAAYQSLG